MSHINIFLMRRKDEKLRYVIKWINIFLYLQWMFKVNSPNTGIINQEKVVPHQEDSKQIIYQNAFLSFIQDHWLFWFFLIAFFIHIFLQETKKNYNFSDTRTLTCYVLTLEKWQRSEDLGCIQISVLWISNWFRCCITWKSLINRSFLSK